MKKIITLVLIMALLCFAAGCGNTSGGNASQSGAAAGSSSDAAGDATDTGAAGDAADTGAAGDAADTGAAADADPSVDIDLTTLSSTMVYAQVNDMICQPEDFMGQTVKMTGPFAVYTDEATKKNYFACIIQDATACCSQGLEFELAGDHNYPADYPEQGDEITVIGTFSTYDEAGTTYCTLKEARFA